MTNFGTKLLNYFKRSYLDNVEYARYGRDYDGGYIMVDDISGDDFGVSFGVFDDISWEQDFLKKGAGVHVYDNSIDELPGELNNSTFFKETVGQEAPLSKVFSRLPHAKDFILKMDIDGGEFDLIMGADEADIAKFRQIVIEIHWLSQYFHQEEYRSKLDASMEKLLKNHTIVWLHGNNHSPLFVLENTPVPDVVELLLVRNDSYDIKQYKDYFSHLEMPCRSDQYEIKLSF